ncbi:hypothetical protein BPTFM16_00675 [Altererythrobacter insulae]|nr:hypothetical protein BPTFM16_00675 [Altererythrobacter insulae]
MVELPNRLFFLILASPLAFTPLFAWLMLRDIDERVGNMKLMMVGSLGVIPPAAILVLLYWSGSGLGIWDTVFICLMAMVFWGSTFGGVLTECVQWFRLRQVKKSSDRRE